jgi:hypothetical protein
MVAQLNNIVKNTPGVSLNVWGRFLKFYKQDHTKWQNCCQSVTTNLKEEGERNGYKGEVLSIIGRDNESKKRTNSFRMFLLQGNGSNKTAMVKTQSYGNQSATATFSKTGKLYNIGKMQEAWYYMLGTVNKNDDWFEFCRAVPPKLKTGAEWGNDWASKKFNLASKCS